MVGEIKAGSFAFKSTALVTPPISWSSALRFKIFNQYWDVIVFFLHLHCLEVPLSSSWIVLSGYNFITILCFGLLEILMKVPINSRKLSSCFVGTVSG